MTAPVQPGNAEAQRLAVLQSHAIMDTAPEEAYFWGTHAGAELDLLLVKNGRRIGVECKRVDAPKLTPSVKTALTDLDLDHLAIVYPGNRRYALSDRVTAFPLVSLAEADGFFL